MSNRSARSLRLLAEATSLARVTAFVHNGGKAAHLPDHRLNELDLIIEEIFINLCRHAFANVAPGTVTFTYSIPNPGRLHVKVTDPGPPFNPLTAPAPDLTLSLADRPLGGLGIHLVKALATSASYQREGSLNQLSFDV